MKRGGCKNLVDPRNVPGIGRGRGLWRGRGEALEVARMPHHHNASGSLRTCRGRGLWRGRGGALEAARVPHHSNAPCARQRKEMVVSK